MNSFVVLKLLNYLFFWYNYIGDDVFLKKRGFASMYMVYSFFLVFILMMLTTLAVNTYKQRFLNALKNDIKLELKDYHIEMINYSENS